MTLTLSFGIHPFDVRGEEGAFRHLSALPAVVFGDEAYLHRSDLRRTHFFWGVYPGAFRTSGVVERPDALELYGVSLTHHLAQHFTKIH